MKNRHKVNNVYNEEIGDNEEKDRNRNSIHSFDNVLSTYCTGTEHFSQKGQQGQRIRVGMIMKHIMANKIASPRGG